MLLDHYVVADGEAKPGAFSGWLSREKRIEDLFSYVGRNASTVVAYPDFYALAKIFGNGGNSGFISIVRVNLAELN